MSQTPAQAQDVPIDGTGVPVWNCEFFKLEGAVDLSELTVGAKFGLKCHGDIAVQWSEEPVRLTFPKEELAYSLAVLKTIRQDPQDAQYEVTAYKAGNHTPEYVRILQGNSGFEFIKPKWTVKSVLNPQQPAQPVPPFGPWNLSLPLWFWIVLAAVLLSVLALTIHKVRRHMQRRRMLEELKRHTTALKPLHQFYKDARQLRRRLNHVKNEGELKTLSTDLDREFRLFVLRRFQVPALDWSNRAILDDLRKRHRKIYQRASAPLKTMLRELDKAKGQANLQVQDLEQLHRMTLDAAEKLDDPVSNSGGGLS